MNAASWRLDPPIQFLTVAKLAGLFAAAHAVHEGRVGLFQQAVGQRQASQLRDGRVDRVDIVADLAPVVAFFRQDLVFGHECFIHAGFGCPSIRLEVCASLVTCISMNRSISGTISEKAFSSPKARLACSNSVLMVGSSQLHS